MLPITSGTSSWQHFFKGGGVCMCVCDIGVLITDGTEGVIQPCLGLTFLQVEMTAH